MHVGKVIPIDVGKVRMWLPRVPKVDAHPNRLLKYSPCGRNSFA
jgi:hypothetical protein